MFRSIPFFTRASLRSGARVRTRFLVQLGLAFLLTLGAASFYFFTHRQQPVPVTGAVKAASSSSAPRSMDLGAGYRLVTDTQGSRIVAPEMMVKPADKVTDLGAGYRLVVTASGGQIVAPARLSTYYQHTDLGAGYVLEVTGESSRIIAPAALPAALPETPAISKMDIGDGHWLVVGPQSGAIVAPANPVHPMTVSKTDLGGGYWLIIGPDGWQITQEGSK